MIFMLLVTSNKSRRLLHIRYIGRVQPAEFQHGQKDLTTQLEELSPRFRLLADFSQLESMGLDCEAELGRMMELIGQAGVNLVVRVIPDPSKDIGMNILTAFHYPHRLQVVTCENLVEAAGALGL
jgi:anti-anti-sigma regulatory factor